jgi:hypothetical protein
MARIGACVDSIARMLASLKYLAKVFVQVRSLLRALLFRTGRVVPSDVLVVCRSKFCGKAVRIRERATICR